MSDLSPEQSRRALEVPEFLARYRIGRTKFYQEVAAGRLELRKIGKKSLVDIVEAERWFASLPIAELRDAAA